MLLPKKLKYILKFNIESNIKNLNPKISTVLSQKRINGPDFITLFKEKLLLFKIKEDVSVNLKVLLFVFESDDYIIHIKMPSLTTLLNRFFFSKKNFDCPGFLFNKKLKSTYFNYIITPYILYEILLYQSCYDSSDSNILYNHYIKCVKSLKSKGINVLYIK